MGIPLTSTTASGSDTYTARPSTSQDIPPARGERSSHVADTASVRRAIHLLGSSRRDNQGYCRVPLSLTNGQPQFPSSPLDT